MNESIGKRKEKDVDSFRFSEEFGENSQFSRKNFHSLFSRSSNINIFSQTWLYEDESQ